MNNSSKVLIKKLTTMTFKEREQIMKKNPDELLSKLIDYQGENRWLIYYGLVEKIWSLKAFAE